MIRDQRLGAILARGYVSTERLPARAQILDFAAVFRGKIERRLRKLLVADRDAKARTKFAQLLFIQLFLLVRDISAFATLAEPVALDRARKNHGGRTLMLNRRLVRRVNFARIVAALAHCAQRF